MQYADIEADLKDLEKNSFVNPNVSERHFRELGRVGAASLVHTLIYQQLQELPNVPI